VIGSFGQIGLNLAGLGRYEEAIARGEEAIATAHQLGAWDIRVTNDSTSPLRDVYALDEARRRSERMVEQLGPSDFNMPWMNARADLICAHLLADDVGAVKRDWPSAWDDALASPAWEHWLITGRLAVVRAQLELELGRLDESLTWSGRAVDLARPVGRRKYEVVSLITQGRALTAQGLFPERPPGCMTPYRSPTRSDRRSTAGRPGRRWPTRLGASRTKLDPRTVTWRRPSGSSTRSPARSRRIGRPGTSPRARSPRCLSARADSCAQTKLRRSIFGPNAGAPIPDASSRTSTRPR
jgi:hypothetical protein